MNGDPRDEHRRHATSGDDPVDGDADPADDDDLDRPGGEPAAEPSPDEADPTDADEGRGDQPTNGPDDDVEEAPDADDPPADPGVPADVQRYERFKKVDRAEYDRVNQFLRDRTYITAREWAIARLCTDFRTETGVEMTKIGEHLPELVPFMTEPYSPQAVNQARHAFETKVRKAGATFLYGAMCDFFTAEELDDVLYEATEVARFLLEVEGVELDLDEELAAEDRIATVMREVAAASDELRHDGATCPACGHTFEAEPAED